MLASGEIALYLVGRLMFGADWTAVFVATTMLILLSFSLISLFFEIIGEYLGRVFPQVRDRPLSLVEAAIDGPEVPSSPSSGSNPSSVEIRQR